MAPLQDTIMTTQDPLHIGKLTFNLKSIFDFRYGTSIVNNVRKIPNHYRVIASINHPSLEHQTLVES